MINASFINKLMAVLLSALNAFIIELAMCRVMCFAAGCENAATQDVITYLPRTSAWFQQFEEEGRIKKKIS